MKPRPLAALLLSVGVLLAGLMLLPASPSAAQDQPARTQRITARLQAGETHAYLLQDLQAGDILTVSMRSTSGNLDPAIGIVDTAAPLDETMAAYQADLQRLLAENESAAQAVEALRNQYFLAWDDDSGAGYAASLAFDVPAQGDYVLIAGSSLSTLGRSTFGDYELLIGLNSPAGQDGAAEPADAPIAERLPGAWGLAVSVEEATGTLTAAAPTASLKLADLDAGQSLTVYAEATSGNLHSGGHPARLRRQGARSRQRGWSGTPGHAGVHHDGKRRGLHAGSAGRLAAGWNGHGGRLPCAGGGERAGCADRASAAARRQGS